MSSLLEVLNEIIKALSQEVNDLGHYLTDKLYSCSTESLESTPVTTPRQSATGWCKHWLS